MYLFFLIIRICFVSAARKHHCEKCYNNHMKNASAIFHHLFSNHKKFYESKCLGKLQELLPPKFKEYLTHLYIKNKTLYFVFSHPAFVMEFNYNKKVINDILKMLQKNYIFCHDITIASIKSYAKFTPPSTLQKSSPMQRYRERAEGKFTIYSSNEEIRKLLLAIQRSIQTNANATK